jgi:myosin-crossreactive antigen
MRSGGYEHEIIRRDRDRGDATALCIVEPIDGHAPGRRREIDVLHEGAGEEVHAAGTQPRDQRFDERLVLIDGRAHNARHVRQVPTFELLKSIPSTSNPSVSVTDEFFAFNRDEPYHDKAHIFEQV